MSTNSGVEDLIIVWKETDSVSKERLDAAISKAVHTPIVTTFLCDGAAGRVGGWPAGAAADDEHQRRPCSQV